MEITHTSTDNTKWDYLGLPAHNSSATSLVGEFAGGIRSGTIAKKTSDQEKMFSNARLVVDQNQAYTQRHCKAKVYSLLYFDMELSMDILMEYHERYIKKNLMTIKLPKTETELKKFASELPKLLQWRDTVVAHTQTFKSV